MVECEFCDEEFDGEDELHVHWLEDHEDDLNSHQKDTAKKAKREKEEQQKQKKQKRKRYVYQGVAGAVGLFVLGVLGIQLLPMITGGGGGSNANLTLEGEPMIGNPDANVTVVEFGDFQCPVCNQFEQGPFQQLKENYIENGQVKFYWKDFPLGGHQWADTAANTMECVYRQNQTAFWSVKSTLFDNQNSVSPDNAEDKIIGWASDEGVESESMRSCLSSGNPKAEVSRDKSEGFSSGVQGTPTVYVNGQQLGSFSYDAMKKAIEEELGN
jgi:protein-disulfide isomerase